MNYKWSWNILCLSRHEEVLMTIYYTRAHILLNSAWRAYVMKYKIKHTKEMDAVITCNDCYDDFINNDVRRRSNDMPNVKRLVLTFMLKKICLLNREWNKNKKQKKIYLYIKYSINKVFDGFSVNRCAEENLTIHFWFSSLWLFNIFACHCYQ